MHNASVQYVCLGCGRMWGITDSVEAGRIAVAIAATLVGNRGYTDFDPTQA